MADSNRKGTFLLSDLRQRSLDGFWETYQTNAQFGWLGGGSIPGPSSRVERIDFSNDLTTPSIRGPLTLARWVVAATSNANYGWWGGGYVSPAGGSRSTIDRVDFANDSPSIASPRGPLSVARNASAATGNQNFGWFAGGSVAPGPLPTERSFIDRVNFASDSPTTASPRGPLSLARFGLAAASNSFYGWFAGGRGSVSVSTVDRIDFATDSPTAAAQRNPISVAQAQLSIVGNSNYAWLHLAGVSYLERIDYSNDLIAPSRRGVMSAGKGYATGTSNANYGWFSGGQTSAPATVSTIERIDFSNDSPVAGSVRNSMTGTRLGQGAVSGISQYFRYETQGLGSNEALSGFAWVAGGNPSVLLGVTTVERINFSNDSPTAASFRTGFTARWGSVGVSNSNYGWFGGGYIPGSSNTSAVVRVDFANDLDFPKTRGSLTAADTRQGGASNQNYGWIAGGFSSIPGSVQRIDFTNDLVTAVTRATVTGGAGTSGPALSETAGTGNADFGWFIGPMSFPTGVTDVSHLSRLQYSNDLIATTIRGPLSGTRVRLAAVANNNFGWFTGGYQGITRQSTVLRVDFSNDSPSASSPRGFLPQAVNQHSASGNNNFGWIKGGTSNAPANLSIVYRIEFSNDLASASTRGPISLARAYPASVSNYVKPSVGQRTWELPFLGNRIDGTYAWLAGGSPGVGFSTVQRIDFSNDSPASPNARGPLSSARYALAAAGNANYGWFIGGSTGINAFSLVDRIDFANDSPASSLTRLNLNQSRAFLAAAGNANFGWVVGGDNNQTPLTRYSTIERINWSSDNLASIRGPLISARNGLAAASNAYYGWAVGGSTGVNTSLVDRIDFANDSPTSASPRGFLSTGRTNIAAASNANFMWVTGGSLFSVDRIDLANDSPASSSPRGPLPVAYASNSQSGNANFSWVAGDSFGNTTISRIDYANDSPTSGSIRGPLPSARGRMGDVSNYVILPDITNVTQYSISANSVGTGAGSFGWFGGGAPGPSNISSVNRIDFSNDSPTSATVRGPLTAAKGYIAATSNANYGWFAGGITLGSPTLFTTVERIDFANDSPTTARTRGNSLIARQLAGAAGNSNYGWFAGGRIPGFAATTVVDRIDYANDNPVTISRGPLTSGRYGIGAAGNANFGWFGGGANPGATGMSTVERIDYSNDSPTTGSTRGPIANRQYTAATANSNFVWFVAGQNGFGGVLSTVDRIDISNDSPTTASARGLVHISFIHQAAGNSQYGWFAGGSSPGPVTRSTVSRIDYSNDSPTSASVRGPLSAVRYSGAGVSNYTK